MPAEDEIATQRRAFQWVFEYMFVNYDKSVLKDLENQGIAKTEPDILSVAQLLLESVERPDIIGNQEVRV